MSGHGQASGPQTFDSPGNVPKHQKTVWLEQTVQAETPASDVVVDANSQKALDVLKACDRGAHRDELAALATSELGLGNDQARQRACMWLNSRPLIIIAFTEFQNRARPLRVLGRSRSRR